MASKVVGAAARIPVPVALRRVTFDVCARYYGVDLNEAEVPSGGYASFDAFFTRAMRPSARPVCDEPDVLASPCDGEVRAFHRLGDRQPIRAKGQSYTVAELVGDDAVGGSLAAELAGGVALTLYLHPRNYHRVHSPCDASVRELRVLPGRLLPVRDSVVRREPGLHARNERLVHVLDCDLGPVVVVMVGALGVGNISCSYHGVRSHSRRPLRIEPADVQLRRGEELGVFHLGSTVIVLGSAPHGWTRVEGPCFQAADLRAGEALLRAGHSQGGSK